jgi:hypothetical protein
MLNGQWNMQFVSQLRKVEAGIIEFDNNKINGGDSNYRYLGEIDLNEGVLAGELRAISNQTKSYSIFGRLDQFKIFLYGDVHPSSMELTGYLADNPTVKIKIECKKVK